MKTDKDLIREGKYLEALGDNYNHSPYRIIPFGKDGEPMDDVPGFDSFEEANEVAKTMDLHNYIIFNENDDWL